MSDPLPPSVRDDPGSPRSARACPTSGSGRSEPRVSKNVTRRRLVRESTRLVRVVVIAAFPDEAAAHHALNEIGKDYEAELIYMPTRGLGHRMAPWLRCAAHREASLVASLLGSGAERAWRRSPDHRSRERVRKR